MIDVYVDGKKLNEEINNVEANRYFETEFINVIGAYDPNTGKSIPKPKRVCTEYDVNLIKKNGDIINYKAQDYRFTKEAVYITTI